MRTALENRALERGMEVFLGLLEPLMIRIMEEPRWRSRGDMASIMENSRLALAAIEHRSSPS